MSVKIGNQDEAVTTVMSLIIKFPEHCVQSQCCEALIIYFNRKQHYTMLSKILHILLLGSPQSTIPCISQNIH